MKQHNTTKYFFLCLAISFLLCTSAWGTTYSYNYNGHHYDVIEASGISWDNANLAAMGSYYSGIQGHLVTITSAEEDAAVYNMINDNNLGEMWAGGYQASDEMDPKAGWTWVNGEGSFPGDISDSPYTNWDTDEPNDYEGPGSEQFLALNWYDFWNDECDLGNIAGYVIEYDTIPEPNSMLLLCLGLMGLEGVRRKLK